VTLWEVTAHTMGNAGLLCQSVIMCNCVTYFITFVLVLEFVWLLGFIVVCNIFLFILKSPNPLKICVLIIPSPWTCYDTLFLSVEFFFSLPIIWNKQCCIDYVNRIIATVYWMVNIYTHNLIALLSYYPDCFPCTEHHVNTVPQFTYCRYTNGSIACSHPETCGRR